MEKAKHPGNFSVFVLLVLLCSVQVALAQSELASKVDELADKLTSSISGEVASVEGDIIYINLGEKDCVYEGSQFEVVRFGEVVMVGNKPIHKERPIGEIQITKVRKDMSLAKSTTSFAQIEKGDKVYQKRKKVTRIALTEFPCGENLNDLTKNIYESLSVYFSQKGMQVVERSQLDKVLQEQKISYSGMIDISTAQKLGQILGTESVLLGTVTEMGNNVTIRARLVDAGKGVVTTAAEVVVTKNPEIQSLLARTMQSGQSTGIASKAGDATAGGHETQEVLFTGNSKSADIYTLKLHSKEVTPEGELRLSFIITSKKDLSIRTDSGSRSYLADDSGNNIPALSSSGFSLNCDSGVPKRFALAFERYPTNNFILVTKFDVYHDGHWDTQNIVARLSLQKMTADWR